MGKRTLINLGLLAGTLGLGFVIAEIAIGVVAPRETMYPRWADSHDYAYALPPNATIVSSRGSLWRFEYTTNRLGLRGTYVSPAASAGTTPVVSLGDSFTFGAGVNDDQVYTEVLGSLLGPAYTVVNAGMGGWGIDSQIKWFFNEGLAYDPRVVTLQFCANDPGDYFGVTRVEDSELTFYPNPNTRPGWQVLISRSALLQKSQLYATLRSLLAPRMIRGQPTHGSSDAAEQTYATLLRAFATSLRDRGSTLLFLSVTHQDPNGAYHYDVDDFPAIRAEVERLEAEGLLRFVDLPLAEMSGLPGSPEGHQWADEHHRLVAEMLAETISDISPLDAPEIGGAAR